MFLLFAALLILADQLSKFWVAHTFSPYGPEHYLGLGFYLVYIKNSGAAFGILPGGTLVLAILSAVVAAAILFFLLRSAHRLSGVQVAALTLILAGALGNMIDRFWLGYVRDFIHFEVTGFNFEVFNLADSFVVIGAGILILSSLFKSKPQPPEKKNPEPDFLPLEQEKADHS
jgi:signal peptidase II